MGNPVQRRTFTPPPSCGWVATWLCHCHRREWGNIPWGWVLAHVSGHGASANSGEYVPPSHLWQHWSLAAAWLHGRGEWGDSPWLPRGEQSSPGLEDPRLNWGKSPEVQGSPHAPTSGCTGRHLAWKNVSPLPPAVEVEPSSHQATWWGVRIPLSSHGRADEGSAAGPGIGGLCSPTSPQG